MGILYFLDEYALNHQLLQKTIKNQNQLQDKTGGYLLMKGTVKQDEINIYAFKNSAPKYIT